MKFLILAFCLIGSFAFAKPPGSWTKGSFSNSAGARDYYLYVPAVQGPSGKWPMVVMLHGCEQDATTFASQTGMNELADKYGFMVLYPEQPQSQNQLKCWNWFEAKNQKRDSGELSLIVGMVQKLESQLAVDRDHVYVAGLSAGAAMSSNLIACYPDIFAGAGIHSGLEFEAASTQQDAQMAMTSGPKVDVNTTANDAIHCSGPQKRLPAVIVFHGSEDHIVNPLNSARIIQQISLIGDALDDGAMNGSQNLTPISRTSGQVPNGYSYAVEYFGGAGQVHLASVTVDHMGHAWSGAHQAGPFADPKGPDAGEMMWQFFASH